ncbi:hypothetical protein BV20DRAFT_591056 [Pilatotrama ljubarskyi]|nr:hypothetical protein BV20DRAFT_591056 [Pilatotrama ljubarskyi]
MGGLVSSQFFPESVMPSPTGTVRCPFDDLDADVICCSSDGVDFHVYKVVLAKASPVFRKIFASFDCPPAHPPTPQVVLLNEDADTLEKLLRLCYPVDRPVFEQLEALARVLAAAKKYDIPAAIRNLTRDLAFFLPSQPLRVYALAYTYAFPHTTREAARMLLSEGHQRFTGKCAPPEVDTLPAGAWMAYQTYHQACVRAAHAVLDDEQWLLFGEHPHKVTYSLDGRPDISTTWLWLRCSTCGPSSRIVYIDGLRGPTTGRSVIPSSWGSDFIKGAKSRLSDRPVGRTLNDPFALSFAAYYNKCVECTSGAPAHLELYARLQGERIDAAISKINLCLPF